MKEREDRSVEGAGSTKDIGRQGEVKLKRKVDEVVQGGRNDKAGTRC